MDQTAFIRAIQVERKGAFSFLLGAGASATSGVPTAASHKWWK
jgi:NAD-dependent SIR2 family protein deacetylase